MTSIRTITADLLQMKRGEYLPEWDNLHPVARGMLHTAADQIGYREIGCNNGGPFVAALKRMTWHGSKPDDIPSILRLRARARYLAANAWPMRDLGAFCASGTSWCIEESLVGQIPGPKLNEHNARWFAAQLAGHHFDLAPADWLWMRHGARRLGEICAAKYGELELPEAGCLAIWGDGINGSRKGHVAPVMRAAGKLFWTIEFNGDMYPSWVHPKYRGDGGPKLLRFVKVC